MEYSYETLPGRVYRGLYSDCVTARLRPFQNLAHNDDSSFRRWSIPFSHYSLGMRERESVRTQVEDHRANVPVPTQICQAEMEFPEVTRRIFLVLPVRLFTVLAKSTLVSIPDFRKEAVIRLTRLGSAGKAQLVDLLTTKSTNQSFFGDSILEYRDDPVESEGTPSMPTA